MDQEPKCDIVVPKFWTLIERNLNIDGDEIKDMKVLLTVLGYTTIQSVSKLSQTKEIDLIELEFEKLKKVNPCILKDHPELAKLNLASGFKKILSGIATKIKRGFQPVDVQVTARKVQKMAQKICVTIQLSQVIVQTVAGEVKCHIICPVCEKKATLSPYWTADGQEFRIFNFQRHYMDHGEAAKSPAKRRRVSA